MNDEVEELHKQCSYQWSPMPSPWHQFRPLARRKAEGGLQPVWPQLAHARKCSVPPGIHQVAVEGGQEILQGLGKTLAEFDMSILEETYHLRAPYHPESGLSRVCC